MLFFIEIMLLLTFSSYTATLQPWKEQQRFRHRSLASAPKLVSFRNRAPRARESFVRMMVFSLISLCSAQTPEFVPLPNRERTKRPFSPVRCDRSSPTGQCTGAVWWLSEWITSARAAALPLCSRQTENNMIRPRIGAIFTLVRETLRWRCAVERPNKVDKITRGKYHCTAPNRFSAELFLPKRGTFWLHSALSCPNHYRAYLRLPCAFPTSSRSRTATSFQIFHSSMLLLRFNFSKL